MTNRAPSCSISILVSLIAKTHFDGLAEPRKCSPKDGQSARGRAPEFGVQEVDFLPPTLEFDRFRVELSRRYDGACLYLSRALRQCNFLGKAQRTEGVIFSCLTKIDTYVHYVKV